MSKKKINHIDGEMMRKALGKSIRTRFKLEPHWEDIHPILATLIVVSAVIFRPLNLLIAGVIAILLMLII